MILTQSDPRPAPGALRFIEGSTIAGWYDIRKVLTAPDGPTVWLATDHVIERDVTLHFIPLAVVGDAPAMAELQRAVKTCRPIIHPNIVRVYDFVVYRDCAAISMARVAGDSLAALLRRKGRFDPDDVKAWIAQLAETLEHMHHLERFHGDLAPANLFAGPRGELLAANFGTGRVIADALERTGIADEAETHRAYIAPGRCDGAQVGASDDVHGFGVLVYELLTGRVPVTVDDSVPKIRRRIRPSMAELRASAGNHAPVPDSWEKTVAACLDNVPEKRPRNFSELRTMMGLARGSDGKNPAADPIRTTQAEPAKTQTGAPFPHETEQSPVRVASAENIGLPHAAGARSGAASEGGDPVPVQPDAREIPPGIFADKTQARQDGGPVSVRKTASRKRLMLGVFSGCSSAVGRMRSKTTSFRVCLAAFAFVTGICVFGMEDDSPLSGGGIRPRMERNRQRARVQNADATTAPARPLIAGEFSLPPEPAPVALNPGNIGTPTPIDPTHSDGKSPAWGGPKIKPGRGASPLSATSDMLVPKSLAAASEDPDAVDLSFEKPRKNAKTQSKGTAKTAAAAKGGRPGVTSTGVTSVAITGMGP